jgi:carboxyl-terminal processing protease
LHDCRKERRKGLCPSLHAILQFCLPAILIASALASQPTLSKNDRDIAMIMLRQIEEDVEKYYYDPAFHGVDLEASVRAAEQRLKTTTGFGDAMATLSELLIQLDDSHTTFLPPNQRLRVNYGWQMAMVGSVPLVVSVEPGSDAAAKGMAPGDRVLMLNSFEPHRANLWRLAYFYRFIRPQALQRVSVLKPDGGARTFDVQSRVEGRPVTELRDLLLDLEDLLYRARDVSKPVGTDTLVWRMSVFGNPEHVGEMIKKARGYKTLVLDLRGNGGGAVVALRELVSRCFDHEVLVATVRHRAKTEREVAKPARSRFTGKLIVLVDSRSASAAEVFARIVQLEKRGTVIGDRTAGAVMTSRIIPHKVGVVGVFYATSITIGDVRMSDGASLEKAGVEPDEQLLPSPSDLAAGLDPVLAAAIAMAGGSLTPDQAGKLFK